MSRKQLILEKAIELFKTQGRHQTSIRQIATVAGVSHSLLHKHWDSKDALFLEGVEVEVERLRQMITKDCSRVENTLHFLLKHPNQWTLIARCLVIPPGQSGEDKRMHAKVVKRIQPLLDDLMELTKCFASQDSIDSGQATDSQASVAWFFMIVSLFSGHCLVRQSLENYLGESDLHVARRVVIDAFYENWIFKNTHRATV